MGKKKWTGFRERKNNHKVGRGGGRDKKPFHKNKFHCDNEDRESREPGENRQRFNRTKSENTKLWKPQNNVLEKNVGITEYIGTNAGFTGVIKARFSDFQVNEIDTDDNLVKLTDKSIPKPPKNDDENAINNSEQNVIKMITQEKWDKIYEISNSGSNNKDIVEVDVDRLTKEERGLIHNTIKLMYGNFIVGTTLDKGGKKHIKFSRYQKGDVDRRTKWLWPHEYTYFVVHKENVDTMKAASDLANNLNTKASSISYAGTKDKRGKTTQLFCIRKREPEKIVRAAERYNHIHVGNFHFKPIPLKLGLLNGNRFRIALRHVKVDKTIIDESLTSLKDRGFINYYGLQRFGNNAKIPTYEIGLSMLKGQFKEAVELILKPREGEAMFMAKVREHWWRNRDPAAALKLLFKTNTSIEAKLLSGLSRHGPNDFINALENIPRNMRLMYIHSYQSLIWNQAVSRRIELGLNILPGDLIFVNESTNDDRDDCTADDIYQLNPEEEVTSDNDETGGEEQDNNLEEATPPTTSTDLSDAPSKFKTMVRPLTEEDVATGKYTIFNVVLPLPGHDITYPTNELGNWYTERLAKDGLSSEKLKSKQKAYSLTGAYRKIIIKPKKLSWELMNYSTESDNLILSDLEELTKEEQPKSHEDGEFQALIIDFCLPSSTYATMVLREILKEDTSPENQSKINTEEEYKAQDKGNGDDVPIKRTIDEVEGDDDDDGDDNNSNSCDESDAKKLKTSD